MIHGAIHRARPEVACVLHCHSHAATAVSCLKEGLLPLTQGALQFYDRVAYHDYESLAFDSDQSARLVENLGDKQVMLLRNHGQLTAARSVPEAFSLAYFLEEASRIQLEVMQSGGEMTLLSDATRDRAGGRRPGCTSHLLSMRRFKPYTRDTNGVGCINNPSPRDLEELERRPESDPLVRRSAVLAVSRR